MEDMAKAEADDMAKVEDIAKAKAEDMAKAEDTAKAADIANVGVETERIWTYFQKLALI